jgi:hypothetical protein
MNGPKRVPFKNLAKLKSNYRAEYLTYFVLGATLSYPVAIAIGKRAMVSQGGVALTPRQRWVDNFPNISPNRTTYRFFRRYCLGFMFICGNVMAQYCADATPLKNDWYTRPDLKPKAAMVDDQTDYDDVAYQQLLRKNYGQYKSEERKKSSLYRWLFNKNADFTPKTNLFLNRDGSQNYQYKSGQFPTLHHTYHDHKA